ncbi:MAG: hypothetical protein KBS74_00885 [Clostridiales bacterium]|nr:hypothetical protein [Candidatus Cacconaster stercorequi]
MFAERFDALMNIAEVSNSLLGRDVNMNPSHIGRLRSGARPLPKKHAYLVDMCRYLTRHITKEYQINALQKLTGISSAALASPESTALYLEQWLLEQEADTSAPTGRLISGFSRLASRPISLSADFPAAEMPQKYAAYLYGNAGKRKAVEQFFMMILREEKPQTLLLFSDENMAWLYEDAVFAARWAELFTKVILKGNRVKIIHTVSRDMNEMLEAVTKWIPIYMTGMIEPYCYPRLRDGVFQRTMFIAPNTAAVVSSSVQQDTDGMLNLFLTDRAALNALTVEYQRYFALCRPLMRIFTGRDVEVFQRTAESLAEAEGDAYLCCAMPPLFAMPERLVLTLSEQTGNEMLLPQWKRSLSVFRKHIKKQHLSLVLLDPECAHFTPATLHPPMRELFSAGDYTYTKEQYGMHIARLRQLEKQYENLKVHFVSDLADNTLLYVKEDMGAIMAKSDAPKTAFVINERNMINTFWDYMEKRVLI